MTVHELLCRLVLRRFPYLRSFPLKDRIGNIHGAAADAETGSARDRSQSDENEVPGPAQASKAVEAGRRLGAGLLAQAKEIGAELGQTRGFRNAIKGAGVGAVSGIPLPVVGPISGAIIGAAAGVFLGERLGERREPVDLHQELLKLADLRDKGLLTEEEFEAQKRKLLRST